MNKKRPGRRVLKHVAYNDDDYTIEIESVTYRTQGMIINIYFLLDGDIPQEHEGEFGDKIDKFSKDFAAKNFKKNEIFLGDPITITSMPQTFERKVKRKNSQISFYVYFNTTVDLLDDINTSDECKMLEDYAIDFLLLLQEFLAKFGA